MNTPVRVLNVDLSTISAATDVAFGFGEPLEELVDINVQSGPDAALPARLHLYNAAYHHHYGVPVRTILILLRSAADHPSLTGRLAYQCGASRVEFFYEVIRQWQQPLQPYLNGGLGVLPLAPLCQLPPEVPLEQALRDVVHQIDQRLASEVPYGRAVQLMTATFVLAGLRVPRQALADVFHGVKVMHESSAFDLYEEKGRVAGLAEGRVAGLAEGRVAGLAEGRVEESHRLLLRQGQNRFGKPASAVEAELRAIRDLDRLERLADVMLSAHTWQEFLATP